MRRRTGSDWPASGRETGGALGLYLTLSLIGHAVLGLTLVHRHRPRTIDEAGPRVVLVTPTPSPEPARVTRPAEVARSPKIRSPGPGSRLAPAPPAAGPRPQRAPLRPETEPGPPPRGGPAEEEPPGAPEASPAGAGQTPVAGVPPGAPRDDGAGGLRSPSVDTGRFPSVVGGSTTGEPASGSLFGGSDEPGRRLLLGRSAWPGSGGGGAGRGGPASGPGDAGTGGAGRRAADPTPGAAVASDARALLALIRDRIERAKVYPAAARQAGIQGQVLLRFRLRPDGTVLSVEMIRSSGSAILDRASEETVARGAPYPYLPGWIRLPLSFRLEQR